MINNIFVLLIGLGRSGTSAVRGFLNLSPDINMAFEENLMILQKDNPKVWAGTDFSFDHHLLQRTIPEEYNGNKIILGKYFVPAEFIAECARRKVVIFNKNFDYIKVLFVSRKKEDLIASIIERKGDKSADWAKENYEVNIAEMKKLKKLFPDHFGFDFYDFLKDEKVREDIFSYLDLSYSSVWSKQKVDTVAYGINYLDVKNLNHYTEDPLPKPALKKEGDFKAPSKPKRKYTRKKSVAKKTKKKTKSKKESTKKNLK